MPRFFQHNSSWSSFTRQLASYRFTRVLDADDTWVFEHAIFAKDQPNSLAAVVRRAAKRVTVGGSDNETVIIVAAKRPRLRAVVDAASIALLHAKLDQSFANDGRILRYQARVLSMLQLHHTEPLESLLDIDAHSAPQSVNSNLPSLLFDDD
jgi:hypothetical protein